MKTKGLAFVQRQQSAQEYQKKGFQSVGFQDVAKEFVSGANTGVAGEMVCRKCGDAEGTRWRATPAAWRKRFLD
jgi:hypothetical protein